MRATALLLPCCLAAAHVPRWNTWYSMADVAEESMAMQVSLGANLVWGQNLTVLDHACE